jgi:hypothetical protein
MLPRERVRQAAMDVGHRVTDDADVLRIELDASDGQTIRVEFVPHVLEWFYSVTDRSGVEVHSNWDDLAEGLGACTQSELEQLLASAAIRFLQAVHGVPVQVAPRSGLRLFGFEILKGTMLQVRREDAWVDVLDLLYPDGLFEIELAAIRAGAG